MQSRLKKKDEVRDLNDTIMQYHAKLEKLSEMLANELCQICKEKVDYVLSTNDNNLEETLSQCTAAPTRLTRQKSKGTNSSASQLINASASTAVSGNTL